MHAVLGRTCQLEARAAIPRDGETVVPITWSNVSEKVEVRHLKDFAELAF
jgi:hypothetical protein